MKGYEILITKGCLKYDKRGYRIRYLKNTKKEVAELIENILVGLHEDETIEIRRKEKK